MQFRKSGFNDEDSATLASLAEEFRNVADSEISAADSASFIIAQMKAFNIEAENAEHILDAVNEISNNFAVSSSDLSENIGKVSASLAVNGVKFEEMLGMMTAVTEVTRNASTASRGLSMISSRLVQVLDDSSSTGKKLVSIYNDLGIALKNEDGQMRSTYDILKDLAAQWNNLSGNQQKYIALTSAGARQTQNFVALMENFDTAIKATATAYDSAGSAAQENERVMDSITKKIEILKSEFQKIVIGEGGLQDFAKKLLDVGTGVLTLINNLGGLPPILATITTYILGINALKIANSISNISNLIVSAMQNLVYALPNALAAWRSYAAGTIAANTAMQATIPLIGLISVAVGALVGAIVNHNRHLEEQRQKIRENIEAFSEERKSLEEVQEKLKDENISREELNNIIDSNLDEYEAERLKLLNTNQARQEAIDLIEKEKQARAQELVDTGLTEYEESLDRIKNGYSDVIKFTSDLNNQETALGSTIRQAVSESGLNTAKTAEAQEKALLSFKERMVELRNAQKDGSYEQAKYNLIVKDTEAVLSTLKTNIKDDTKIVKLFNEALNTLGKRYDETSESIKEGSERWGETLKQQEKALQKTNETINLTQEEKKELESLKEQYNITENAIDDYREAHQEANLGYYETIEAILAEQGVIVGASKSLEELQKNYEDSQKSANALVSSIKEVASALEEQEKQGSLSVETQLKLIEEGYALALAYDKETGACTINKEAVVEMTKAKLEAQIAAQRIAQAELTDMLQREASAAISNAKAFLLRAKAMGASATADYAKRQEDRGYTSSISGYGANWGYVAETESRKMYDAYDKTINALQTQLDNFEKNGTKAFKSVGNAAKSAGRSASNAGKDAEKAAQDAKKAIQEQTKALEEQKKKYDIVIKWIEKQYDKEIDKIKKAKKEAVEAEEAKIKAKEKEKDKALDAIEAEIKALKNSKDARKKYWDDQIDALKKANKESKDALELQEKLDALQKARNTKVKIYKEGQGFVYDVDQTEVAKAQKALDEYLSEKAYEDELARLEALRDAELDNFEQRIDALEDYKDKVQENYEQQIEILKIHKEELEKQYDAEIEIWENLKQGFQDMVNEYEDEQARLLASQEFGINIENNNWLTRLDNLRNFVDKYKALLAQIEASKAQEAALNAPSVSTPVASSSIGGGSYSGGVNQNWNPPTTRTVTNNNTSRTSTGKDAQYTPNYTATKNYTSQGGAGSQSGNVGYSAAALKKLGIHAKGIDTIPNDEIAIVGESPNQEMVIGSKLNGKLMSLDKGTGVVNAESSKSLAGMLNQIGKYSASGFGSGNGTLNNNINNDSLVINGVTIQGANIKDPETFVNGLLSLKSKALQRAYAHK